MPCRLLVVRLSAVVLGDSSAADQRRSHPFTAPWVSPATIRRWKITTTITTGMVTTMAAAEIAPEGSSNCEAPVKNDSAAGTGRAASVDVNEMPYTKSFHAIKNAIIAVVKTPGAARGTTVLRNASNGVAPSTCAACSSSHGICLKKADSVQIAMGNVRDRYGMISPSHVS